MTVYADVLTNKDEKIIIIPKNTHTNGNYNGEDEATHHSTVSLVLMLSGRGELYSDKEATVISESNILIIPSECNCRIKPGGRFRALIVSGRFDLLSHLHEIQLIHDSKYSEGRRLAELVYYNRDGNEGYLDCLCRALVRFVLLSLKRAPKNTVDAIHKIILRMENDFGSSDLSIGKLLDDSGYSRDYIRTEFESVAGITPKKYLNNVRMKKAAAMIEHGDQDITISEIAERCGIIDPTIFSRIFKHHFGVSPSQYRESLKNKITDNSKEL